MNTETTRARDPKEDLIEKNLRREERVEASYEKYHVWLLGEAVGLTGNRHDAEDLCQWLWRAVFRKFKDPQIDQPVLLRRKLYQLFVDHYRWRSGRNEVTEGEVPETPAPARESEDLSDEGEAKLERQFWEEFAGIDLSENQKLIIFKYARYGYTYAELSEQTGIAVSTIGDWIALARIRIRDYINTQR